jgi:RNA polymerase sigma factor (sigma-70 family)
LQRFAHDQDDTAFAILVQRHGRLVWGVCRHILGNEHDAEDAFQGTFLVLACKAGSIRDQTAVGSWLHGVAYRIARKAKLSATRRRRRESQAASPTTIQAEPDLGWRELQAVLDEELNRLPNKYRAPFVLCCLEGKTKKEAADELHWKEGTVSSRLATARKLLQHKLSRRGVTLAGALGGAAVAQDSASGAVPVALAGATVSAATAFARGLEPAAGLVSSEAIALAKQVLATPAFHAKLGAVLVLLLAVAAAGAGTLLHQRVAPPPNLRAQQDAPPAGAEDDNRRPRPTAAPAGEEQDGPIAVGGRVIDAQGKPLPGAKVAVITAERRQPGEGGLPGGLERTLLQLGHADPQGEFQLAIEGAAVPRNYVVALIASSPGRGLDAHLLTPGQSRPRFDCVLPVGHVSRGRLVDSSGNPAAHVAVHVAGLHKKGEQGHVLRFQTPPLGLGPWPAPVMTDDQGTFLLRDVGPDQEVELQIRDERFASQWLVLSTGAEEITTPVTFVLASRRLLEGTVTASDTGKPIPGVRVSVQSQDMGTTNLLPSRVEILTDDQGRFRAAPFPGQELKIAAHAARDLPYLGIQNQTVRWPAGAASQQVRIRLPRGVRFRGRVVEAGSGRPVPGAQIEYRPRFANNPFVRSAKGGALPDWWSQTAPSGPDGAFRLTVLPGPGWLLVKGPGADYVHTEMSARQLEGGKPGGMPYFFDAVIPIDPQPSTGEEVVTAALRRGVILTGRVLAADRGPAPSALMLSPTYIPSGSTLRGDPVRVHDGRYELPGVEPDRRVPVLFFDPQKQAGAFAELSGSIGTREEATVRLEPCGSATVKFVGANGKPVSPRGVLLEIVLRSGAGVQKSIDQDLPVRLTVPAQRLGGYECISLDQQAGTATFSSLVPHAPYLIQVDSGQGPVAAVTFAVPPGAKVKLPDITLEPRRP